MDFNRYYRGCDLELTREKGEKNLSRQKRLKSLQRMERERLAFEEQFQMHMRVIFFNTSFTRRKQVSARNFWINLDAEMPLNEIYERLKKGFGDLEVS